MINTHKYLFRDVNNGQMIVWLRLDLKLPLRVSEDGDDSIAHLN